MLVGDRWLFTQWRHVCSVIEASLADVSVITLHSGGLTAAASCT